MDAVVSVLRYATGMPHHRLAQWQKWAGVPFAASTQFERVEAMANAVFPVFRHMETIAANRPLVHSDDTGARILTLMAENETLTQGKGERTGIFTTGIVARGLDATLAPIILYASGRWHAGENMDRLLNQRTVQESDVIHMADASSMAPRSPRRITAKCMVHARRYFFEAEPAFPEHCERVLEDIATIYRNDDETRDMTPDARLAYHQQHSRPVMDALYEWIEKQWNCCQHTQAKESMPLRKSTGSQATSTFSWGTSWIMLGSCLPARRARNDTRLRPTHSHPRRSPSRP